MCLGDLLEVETSSTKEESALRIEGGTNHNVDQAVAVEIAGLDYPREISHIAKHINGTVLEVGGAVVDPDLVYHRIPWRLIEAAVREQQIRSTLFVHPDVLPSAASVTSAHKTGSGASVVVVEVDNVVVVASIVVISTGLVVGSGSVVVPDPTESLELVQAATTNTTTTPTHAMLLPAITAPLPKYADLIVRASRQCVI
jgi:hypothetical protein